MTIETEPRERPSSITMARPSTTPCYRYDLEALRERVAEFRQAFAGCDSQLYFATMANDVPEVLAELAGLGVGACVNSLGHLRLAASCGFTQIQFTSTALPRTDLRTLAELDIPVNLDSPAQLRAWSEVGGRRAGLRINAASLGAGRPFDRIGIAAGTLRDVLDVARGVGVAIEGLHVYVGTNLQDHQEVVPTIEALFRLSDLAPGLRYLNLGGGVGVDYRRQGPGFDVAAYGDAVAALWRRRLDATGEAPTLVVEPGRGLVAACGVFAARVTDIKTLEGKLYAGVDASISVFPRPFHHPESPHHIELEGGDVGRTTRRQSFMVVGCTTFSRDVLGEASLPADLAPGDVLLFRDAGAYCQSMRSRFLGQPEPIVLAT